MEKAAEAQKEKAELRENGEVISVLVESSKTPKYGGSIVTLKNRNPNKKHANIRRGENVALDRCDYDDDNDDDDDDNDDYDNDDDDNNDDDDKGQV